jgi:hypothetical protein
MIKKKERFFWSGKNRETPLLKRKGANYGGKNER